MNYSELPRGYKRILKIDLEKDRLGMVFVSSLSCFVMLIMLLIGVVISGTGYMRQYIFVDTLTEFYKTVHLLFIALFGLFVYGVLRELLRELFIKILCKECKVRLEIKALYFYVASSGYFSKRSYFVISFLPFVLFGAVLLLLCFLVPEEYFLAVYLILILNTSGFSGELYVGYFVSRFDDNLLIKDTGKTVCFYSKT